MKKIIKSYINLINNAITSIIISFIYPVMEVIDNFVSIVFSIFEADYSKYNDFLIKNLKTNIKVSFIIYYLMLVITEIVILGEILGGEIKYYEFSSLIIYTIIILIFSLVFVIFLNKNYKSKSFNYIIYFQILFLLPLIVVYWIANIEGHNLYLKDLNSDQWISLFNTIIIYFSGCLIGIVTLYKK